MSDKSDLDDEWENLLDDLEVVDKAKQAPPRPPRPESKTEPRVPPPPPSSRGGEPRNPDDDTTYRFVADRKPALRPPPRPLPVPAQRASAPSAAKPPRPASEAAERPRSDQTGAEKAPPPAAERPPVDKAAADKAAMEKAAADKAAADKAAADKAAADKAAADKAAADKDAADKVAAAHKAAADKAAMEKAAAEKAAAARRAAAEKAALERSAAEKAALDRAAAEKAERERLAAEAAAQQHAELQRRRGLVGPEAGDADWLAALEDEPLQTAGEAREPELAPSEPVSAPVAPYSDSHRKDPVCAVWLSGTCFGLPVSIVGEYAPITSFTDVPLAPDHVLGVFNLRGMALPVVDLAGALGFEGTKTLKRALVLGDGSIQFAVPADRVEMIAAQRQRGRRPRGAMDHPAVEGFLELDDQRVITLLSGQAVVQAVARLGEG